MTNLSKSAVSERALRRLHRRALAERRWSTVTLAAGVAIVGVLAAAALLAPLLAPHAPNEQVIPDALLSPRAGHIFGTDNYGRDIFSRVLYALRLDLQVGLVITYLPGLIGVSLGLLAGRFGGIVDGLVMRLVDLVVAFPFLVLVLAIVAIRGPGLSGIYIGVSLVGWALYARLTRAEMLVLREQPFLEAAEVLGFSTPRILLRHALPNVLRPNIVFSMTDIVLNILLLASLSYLGIGAQAPTAELGVMVAEGQTFLLGAWWITTFPGLAVVLLGIGFSLIGDGLADRLGEQVRLAA